MNPYLLHESLLVLPHKEITVTGDILTIFLHIACPSHVYWIGECQARLAHALRLFLGRALSARQWLASTLVHSVGLFQLSDFVQQLLSKREGPQENTQLL